MSVPGAAPPSTRTSDRQGRGGRIYGNLHFEVVLFALPPIFAAAMGMANATAKFMALSARRSAHFGVSKPARDHVHEAREGRRDAPCD